MVDKPETDRQNAERKDADLAKKGGAPGPSGYGGMADQDGKQERKQDESDEK